MKILFFIGIVIGFAATLAGARFYPWVDVPRVPSHTTVVANGGRAEQFLIRLPADRISSQGSPSAGVRAAAFPEGAVLPADWLESPGLIEQFKLRDRTGDVIGLAARHWTETVGNTATAWLIVIPGRGAMLLAGPGESTGAVDAAMRAGGHRPGEAWSGDLELIIGAEAHAAGRMLAGTLEFDGLDGRYTETWRLAGIDAAAALRGTIVLDTVTYRGADADTGAE